MVAKKGKEKKNHLCNARRIIYSFYFKSFTLLSYIRKVKNDRSGEIIQDGDPAEYRQLLRSTIIAVPRDQSVTPPFKPSHTQWCTLKEIINRVIGHFCRLNKSNVLAFGFETLKANEKSGTVAGTVGLQNSYPNTIVSYLRTAKAWQLLHERIGDDLMVHLLQNVAVFVKMTSKCYFQVAGFPINRLTPLTSKDVPYALKLQDIKQSKQPPSDGDHTRRIRKIRRGGKRVQRSHRNILIQKENDLNACVGVVGTSATSTTLVSKEICNTDEASASSSDLTVNQHGQPEFHKRKASSSVTDVQEEPCAKKARTFFSFIEVSPSLFPMEAGENHLNSSANSHTSSDLNHSEMTENEIDKVMPGVEVSPLLFPEDEPMFPYTTSEMESKNAHEKCTIEKIVMPLLQEDTELIAVDKCSNGHLAGDGLHTRGQEKEMIVLPVEKKGELKRKHFSKVGVNEKVASKATNKRKPWKYLLKLLPKSLPRKSLPKKGPVPKHKEKCQTKKRKRIQANNSKGHLTSKKADQAVHLNVRKHKEKCQTKKRKRIKANNSGGRLTSKKTNQGTQLNEVYLPHSRLFHASNLSQAFPKKHIMETTPVSMSGARRLVHHIFLKESCLISNGEKGINRKEMQNTKNMAAVSSSQRQTPTRGKKPFRLPRRLKRIQPILLKFLAKHKKCPFRTLLRHYCFYACNSKETRKQARCTRVKKSLKKKRVLARITLPKGRVSLKHPWEKGQSKVSKSAHHKKKAKVDVSVHRHAVKSFTRQDQVCTVYM